MSKEKDMIMFFLGIKQIEDWKDLLISPKHWKEGHSAKALANCWWEAKDFPEEIKIVFKKSKIFNNIELCVACPEFPIYLNTKKSPSHIDIFCLAKDDNTRCIVIVIEGKAGEPFDKSVGKWLRNRSKDGGGRRLRYLSKILGISLRRDPSIMYQLINKSAAAIIGAKQFHAAITLVIIHSFGNEAKGFDDFSKWVKMLNHKVKPEPNEIYFCGKRSEIKLYLSWVNGDPKHLESR